MKYAHHDETGTILGFYDDDIHSTIPAPSIPITDAIWQECLTNQPKRKVDIEHGEIVEFTPPPPPPPTREALLGVLRPEINKLLRASDFTRLDDTPLTAEKKNAWKIYRQALRDMPELTDGDSLTMEAITDPSSSIWPSAPAAS